jgi:hypothetical protein
VTGSSRLATASAVDEQSLIDLTLTILLHNPGAPMKNAERNPLLYDKTNDKVRVDSFKQLEDHHFSASLMTFYRHIDAPFIYHEQIVPAMADGETRLFTAVRDRAWPPWGLGAKRVGAVCQVSRVGENRFSISPVHTADADRTNIGLIAAVYKEALETIAHEHKGEISYLVIEGSVLADRVLRAHGFERSEDYVVSGDVRYEHYRANAASLAASLGLDKLSLPELLAHEIEDKTFHRLNEFLLSIHTATGSKRRDWRSPEILAVTAGIHWDSPPAQVPPPISRGPGSQIEIPRKVRPVVK